MRENSTQKYYRENVGAKIAPTAKKSADKKKSAGKRAYANQQQILE